MKEVFSNYTEKSIEVFSKFQFLWKTEDSDWVSQRKHEWAIQNSEYDDIVTAYLGKYYVYGITPPDYLITDTGDQINIKFRFDHQLAYTPFNVADQIEAFWELALSELNYGDRQHAMARNFDSHINKLPYVHRRVEDVSERLFNDENFNRCVEGPRGRLSIEPHDFVIGYTNLYFFFNDESVEHLKYYYYTVDYFLKCLCFCEKANTEEKLAFCSKKLISMFQFLNDLDDRGIRSEERKKFKQELIDLGEDNSSPEILQNAYRAAS